MPPSLLQHPQRQTNKDKQTTAPVKRWVLQIFYMFMMHYTSLSILKEHHLGYSTSHHGEPIDIIQGVFDRYFPHDIICRIVQVSLQLLFVFLIKEDKVSSRAIYGYVSPLPLRAYSFPAFPCPFRHPSFPVPPCWHIAYRRIQVTSSQQALSGQVI